MDRLSIYDRVTNQIIADLEQGVMPYVKPWKDGVGRAGFAFPANATTEKTYSGINTLILWCAGSAMNYPTQRWLTFKQAQAAGGGVRKGEKGETIVRASTFVPKDEKKSARDEDRYPAAIPFLKAYTVFNVDQCDGLDAEVMGIVADETEEPAIDLPINEAAEHTIAASGVRIVAHPDKAFYRPADDVIAMPPMRAFHEPINYYRTILHELAHYAVTRIMLHGRVGWLVCRGSAMQRFGIIRAIPGTASMEWENEPARAGGAPVSSFTDEMAETAS